MPDKIILNPKNTQIVRLLGLVTRTIQGDASVLETPVNDATLLGNLYNGKGCLVAGVTNVTFIPIGSPPIGDYFAQVSPFEADPGGDYVFILDGSGSSSGFHVEFPVELETRESG